MQNQVASEAINSAKYVENYLDCVENLPNEIQRYSSRIREVDVQYREHLRDYDRYYTTWQRYADMPDDATDSTIAAKKARLMTRLTNCLIAAQELGDEKLQVVTQLQDMIELKTRTLDGDLRTLDYNKDEMSLDPPPKDPVIVTAPQAPFSPPIIPVTTGSILVATTSNVPTNNTITNERFAAAAVSTTQTAINERTSKRVRRSRTDTNSGAAIDLIPSDSINATIDIPLPIKQQASSTSSSASVHIPVASTAAVNKKTVAAAKKTKKRKTGRGQSNTNVSGAGGNTSGGANNSNCAGGQANTRDNRDDTPPAEEAIDPDEPTYCLCDQISFGEMILCDNDLCPIEWFHFSCVSLMSKPKGKWFCPNCRGDRPNVMKPKQQFLKELERYNKEKEEKT